MPTLNLQRGAFQGGAGANVDYDESSDAMVTVLMSQVSSLMREKKALLSEINTLARDNQVLASRTLLSSSSLLSALLCGAACFRVVGRAVRTVTKITPALSAGLLPLWFA